MSSIHVDNTMGAVLVGSWVTCIVYGILLTQIYSYFQKYPEDRSVYKFLVILLVILETADQACISHIIYHYSILNFVNPLALLEGRTTWSLISQQMLGAMAGAIVKTSFTLRVWGFSQRNYLVTGILMLLTLVQLGVALSYTGEAFQLPSISSTVQLKTLGSAGLALGVVTDLSIALSLCYFLSRLRGGTYQQSNSIISGLMRYAINTGIFTGTVSLATLILYNIMPDNLIFVSTYFLLIYAISFMATLNTRRTGRRPIDSYVQRDIKFPTTDRDSLNWRLPTHAQDCALGQSFPDMQQQQQDFPRTSRSGYSDFFASGLRAMTSRVSSSSSRPSSVLFPSSQNSSTSPFQRMRTLSVTVPPSEQTGGRQRRSSIVDFSSRLFEKMLLIDEASSFGKMNETRRRLTRNPDSNSRGSLLPDENGETIDPFAASPDSKSFFIDLTTTPPAPQQRSRHSRRFSLTPSGTGVPFFNLPFIHRRPTSIHTLPLPSPRAESVRAESLFRSESKSSWDENPGLLPAASSIEEESEEFERNDPATMDWRQFHIEFLKDED
ncbi:hypothetical protein C8J56DRAFT_1060941 [Mycena floridula]|nr:hypothetical protein C8J56DRAFT_1060941 [Mycena floridula]